MSWKPSTYLVGTPTVPVSVEVASTATTIAGPLVESGRFFHVILQVPVGTATASQIIRGVVQVTGRYEQ